MMRRRGTHAARWIGLMAVVALIPLFGVGQDVADARTGDVRRIIVLVSGKGAPFEEAVVGFQKYLGNQKFQVRYTIYNLQEDPRQVTREVQEIKTEKPDLLFTVGTFATEAALKEIRNVPIVAGMIYRADRLKNRRNATGVYLEFPMETQLTWLRRMLPEARTVGVIYNPVENRNRIEAAARIARNMGLRLDAREVESPQDIPAALESIGRKADVLWILSDAVASALGTARYVLLFSFRTSIPVVGLSTSWVKAGALYSLEWDYGDVGSQCGEMALRVLEGEPADSIPPVSPRRTDYVLNMNTARQLKVDLHETIVPGAKRVFLGGD